MTEAWLTIDPAPSPRPQDILEYRKKQRPLRVRTLDGTVKTLLVDDSQTVAELTKQVCARIGEWSRGCYCCVGVANAVWVGLLLCGRGYLVYGVLELGNWL